MEKKSKIERLRAKTEKFRAKIEKFREEARVERDHRRLKLQDFARWGFEDEETIAEFNKGIAEYKEKYGKDLDFSKLRNDKLGCIAWLSEGYSPSEILTSGYYDKWIKTPADKELAMKGKFGELMLKHDSRSFFWCFCEWKY